MSNLAVTSHPMFVALLQHLWQTTLFTVAVWLLTVLMRNNRAQARFRLWLLASLKFLLPLSLLIAAGQHLRPARSQATAPIAFTMVMQGTPNDAAVEVATGAAVAAPAAAMTAKVQQGFDVTRLLIAVWAIGAIGLLTMWLRRWAAVRNAVRQGSQTAMIDGIPAITTTAQLEPGVFGILRPVLLLPTGIQDRLTPMELRGILAHELSHVRRRDNLTATVHMLVQAIFWFHPMVWVIGARMLQEREAACDAAVLEAHVEAETYAEGILKICRMYVETPVPCVAGVTGADLKQRIVRILSGEVGRKLSIARKLVLTTLSIAAVTVPILFGILHATTLQAAEKHVTVAAAFRAVMEPPILTDTTPTLRIPQVPAPAVPPAPPAPVAPPPPIATDLRSAPALANLHIQPSSPYRPGHGIGMMRTSNYESFSFRTLNLTVTEMISMAYGIQARQIIDGPRWIDTERYDVEGDVKADVTRSDLGPLLRKVLTERFGIRVKPGRRELQVYVLSVSKDGHHLRKDERDPNGPFSVGLMAAGNLVATNASIPSFCRTLQQFTVDRPLLDRTGLRGRWDFDLQWHPDASEYSAINMPEPRNLADDKSPTLLSAIREQLGLNIEPTVAPMNVLVLERVSRPKIN